MQEYPEDLGRSMSEVYHGRKMLFELSSDIRPPTVKVNRKTFFIDELLQLSTGGYFIPKHFFYSKTQNANTGGPAELNAQGFIVHPQEVSNLLIAMDDDHPTCIEHLLHRQRINRYTYQ
jgi:hypothetical protein